MPYVQGDSREDVEKFLSQRGWVVPVPYGQGFGAYPGDGTIPHAYVIGPDGKVVFEGKKGYEAAIEEQLKRIKYPGLGKLEVAPGLEKAAKFFVDGAYAKSKEEAAKVKEKKADEAAVVEDADFIIARVDETATKLREKVTSTKEAKRYHESATALEALANGFKGTELGDSASDELKEFRKEFKDELKAWDQLERTLEAVEKAKDAGTKRQLLERFAGKFEGTAAAAEAKKLHGEITG
jgi:3-dehydroquinate synthase class II